ncbi:hypothetical protein RclHR1_01040030 [Rhizophagus clarus]|uniref:Uncharacterized protein n=1 Tax=Rhizophagus clarus TaxID=94130 RepID=A0A2Z6Q2H9_9GLOM|nr:hypothetical protein RclHR1_01040030 [Rhizophagus clarus]
MFNSQYVKTSLIQPQIFKSSEFRIRAPKKIQQEFRNHKSVYPIHLFASSQQEHKQGNNEFEQNYYEFEQDHQEFERNHKFEQVHQEFERSHGFEQDDQEFEQSHGFEQDHQEFERNHEFEQNERNYGFEQDHQEFEQDSELDPEFIFNNDPKTFDGKKNFFSNENNSEFGPFNSFTIMAFFHPLFKVDELCSNLQKLKSYRQKLPLMEIQSHMVPINIHKTPSTSKEITRTYYFSLTEHLIRILQNPSINSKLYFGPGVYNEVCEEFWHGNLWAESPLFGQSKIVTEKIIYYGKRYIESSNTTILTFDEIPLHFKSQDRLMNASKKLWMLEETILPIIDILNIVDHCIIWLEDNILPSYYNFSIAEIIYKFNNRWKIRGINLRHQHPIEHLQLQDPPFGIPVLKFFLDLYYDDFGTFRNTYHSLGGVYLQIGNMSQKLRKQLQNHFIIGLVPFGANIHDFIKPFLEEVRQLEHGFVITINNKKYWLTGGLGIITADLPQGNDIARILRHNAKYGCRSYYAAKDDLTNISFDTILNSRYHQITNLQFKEIQELNSNNARIQRSTELGLRGPGPLDPYIHYRHLHIPQDPYHAVAGKVARFLECTCSILTSQGESSIIQYWKAFETPRKWARLPNLIKHRHSFMMSDVLRLSMILPFILKRCLHSGTIKSEYLTATKERLSLSHQNNVIKKLVKTWALVAKASKEIFSTIILQPEYYDNLSQTLNNEHHALLEMFPTSFGNLPNLHINRHLVDHARNYGTCTNMSVGIKEMVHRIFKGIVPHTNKHNLELILLQQINTFQTLRYLANGGLDDQGQHSTIFANIIADPKLKNLLSGWYIKNHNLSIHSNEEESLDNDADNVENSDNTSLITNMTLIRCSDIYLRSKWCLQDIEAAGFISPNLHKNGLLVK